MTTVQIAIRDRSYAGALRDLLVADGKHCVYVVDYPSPAMDGVVVADEKIIDRLRESKGVEFSRCIVFIRQLDFDANRLFDAGVRYVIHADAPPDVGRLIVVAAERRLNQPVAVEQHVLSHAPDPDLASMFDAADKLFLQALRISDR